MSGPLDELMARRASSLLREMRDADPMGYREMFSNFIPLDAPPSEVYSDRQLEVIYGAGAGVGAWRKGQHELQRGSIRPRAQVRRAQVRAA